MGIILLLFYLFGFFGGVCFGFCFVCFVLWGFYLALFWFWFLFGFWFFFLMQGCGEGKPNNKKPRTFLQPAHPQCDKAVAAGLDQLINLGELQQKCCACGLTLPGESTRSGCVLMFALGVTGAIGCGRGRGFPFPEQGAVCVSITCGGESSASQHHPVCSWGGDWWWVAGGKSTPTTLYQRDTAPANITCQRNSSFSALLGCVINSSLNGLKCEIYQPSVIFSVIYSIWCDPPNFGVEIKLVEFTFHSFLLLCSPGACLVFVFRMCI